MIELKGKNALVTGGSRGIGAAVCRVLARAGADVALAYRDAENEASALVEDLESIGRRALAVRADLSQGEACRNLFDLAKRFLGSIDIVVANAGIWKRAAIDEMDEAAWRETLAINLDSIYHTCHHAAKIMKPQKSGNLILIGSTAGQRGEAFFSHYAATKGAIIAMVRSLAAELGPFNINVNCVAPGWVLTDMTQNTFCDASYRESVEQSIPLGRIAEPEDVAGPVVFLASELARHVQGAVINVNGGSVLC